MAYEKLADLARTSLRSCYRDQAVVASEDHFSDFWLRDAMWSVPGMVVAGDVSQARSTLLYFASYIDAYGRVPRKVMREYTIIKYLFGLKKKRAIPKPLYTGPVPYGRTMDSGFLFVYALAEYVTRTDDDVLAERLYIDVRRLMTYYLGFQEEGLIRESGLANWMDTVFKSGAVLSTNVLAYKALISLAQIAKRIGHDSDMDVYAHKARRLKQSIKDHFWCGTHFKDQAAGPSKPFDVAGNTMAVVWGVADEVQGSTILEFLQKEVSDKGFVSAVPQGYTWYKINLIARLFGIGDYHTRASWLWVNALVAHAFILCSEKSQATMMLDAMQVAVARDGAVGETYDVVTTKLYKKRLWRSAIPFAWSAGVVLTVLSDSGYNVRKG